VKLAVVIPFLNEAARLPHTLAALFRAIEAIEAVDVIAVDGGSSDSSRNVLARYPSIRVCDAPPGRASQMNTGARAAADAEMLLFLHADSRLPSDAITAIRDALRLGWPWGRFDVTIEGRSKLLPAVSSLMNLRSRTTGIATGDQAMFVSRKAFDEIGGFPPIPLMEDVALSKALLRAVGRPACLRKRVVTSGRRWDTQGAWRTIALMWRLRFDYWRGIDAATIARRYRPVTNRLAPVLQIFAKDPQPGMVKTRLARSIGNEAAADLYRGLVERTLQTGASARTMGIVSAVELWCDPDERRTAFVSWRDRYGVTLKTQRGADLGVRMRQALSSVLADGVSAILIGTDSPPLDTAYLARAAEALAGHDVVIGPAEDGGYVLMALSRDVDLFTDVPWSTEDVMAATRAKVIAAQANWTELNALWDVDTPADVARFINSSRTQSMGRAFPWRRRPAGFRRARHRS
jgi:rSAM/selenodomain-associated transferase 2/rSAM/selenodomain-associated transferase 1